MEVLDPNMYGLVVGVLVSDLFPMELFSDIIVSSLILLSNLSS